MRSFNSLHLLQQNMQFLKEREVKIILSPRFLTPIKISRVASFLEKNIEYQEII